MPRTHRLVPLPRPLTLPTINPPNKSSISILHRRRKSVVLRQLVTFPQRLKGMDKYMRVENRVNRGQVQAWTPLFSRRHPRSAAGRN